MSLEGDRGKKFLLDPYLDFARGEGVPVVEDFAIDLLAMETAPWDRFGVRGAFAHLVGRGDFVAVQCLELPPGATSAPMHHLYDEVFYVLSGHGSTTLKLPDGREHSFEWGPRSVFAPPLNCEYRLYNGSGREPARLASGNNLPLMMNVFHNERLHLRLSLRLRRPHRPRDVVRRRRRDDRGQARLAHVGDQLHPRPRRLRPQGMGGARRRAPRTSS